MSKQTGHSSNTLLGLKLKQALSSHLPSQRRSRVFGDRLIALRTTTTMSMDNYPASFSTAGGGHSRRQACEGPRQPTRDALVAAEKGANSASCVPSLLPSSERNFEITGRCETNKHFLALLTKGMVVWVCGFRLGPSSRRRLANSCGACFKSPEPLPNRIRGS